ncbi:MAG: response regulator transcription factor [Anaerolineaceae bacterium]
MKLLLVEAKRNPAICFGEALELKGYQVWTSDNGTAGVRLLDESIPSLVVINAASLRTNGLRIVSRFRNRLPKTPIILIIGEEEPLTVAEQADILMRFPFTVQKLINRIQSYKKTNRKHELHVGILELNTLTNMVRCNGKSAHLTPRLAHLLKMLMSQPGRVISRDKLFKEVWETDYTEDTRTLDTHISWLRQAIEENPRKPEIILTARTKGYQLNLADD